MLSHCARQLCKNSKNVLKTQEFFSGAIRCAGSSSGVASVPEEKKSGAVTRDVSKKKQDYPFVKSLFLGKFDTDMLTYPELDKEKLQTLNDMVVPIEKYFDEKVDSKAIDQNSSIPKETLDDLKAMGLFGQQIPEEYGGLGLGATEFARLGEITALDGSIAVTLAAHQSIGLKGILIAGTEEQKKKYLPRLATGEWIAAFCLTEPSSGSDAASIQTRATLAPDGKTWILNGGKIWISNGGIAQLFTVFAKVEAEDNLGKKYDKVTAFIVERDFGGVSSGKPEDKLGIRGSNTCEVHFENTPVPAENILGEVGDGFKVAMKILNSGRFSMGSSSAGILKRLLRLTCEHATNRQQFGKPLKDFHMIKEKISTIACLTYAMESMAYLTAGVLDNCEDPDCAVEAAVVKVFSSEGCWYGVSECLQILGGMGYMKDYPFERILRDTRIMMIFEGTNEILRIFISLMGLQYAGINLAPLVKQLRNPLFHPGVVVKKMWERRRHGHDNPALKMGLDGYLHPSLSNSSKILEYCVLRLQYSVELLLERHGAEIQEHQMDLRRLADMAIDCYAVTAVLARSSRSYCIGLRNAGHEIQMAKAFTVEALHRVKALSKEVEVGHYITRDASYRQIADTLFENHGYCAEHPLTRNF